MTQSITDNRDGRFDEEEQVPGYRAISPLAVCGLVIGCLAPAAFGHPLLWLLPLLGIALNLAAIRHVARESQTYSGRRAALIGLALSLLSLSSAATRYTLYELELRGQARAFAMEWFEYLRAREPEKAHQLTTPPAGRWPMDDALWANYRSHEERRNSLLRYVVTEEPRAIMALGKACRVQFVHDVSVQPLGAPAEGVLATFAVTFQEDGHPKTFFLQLTLRREYAHSLGAYGWWITEAQMLPTPPAALRAQLTRR